MQKTNRKQLKWALVIGVVALGASIQPGSARADGIPCTPINVIENQISRVVMVECQVAQNGVKFVGVAANASDAETQARAQRFISMALAAQLSGQKFFVWTSDNVAHIPPGCPSNCRRADQYGLQK